MFEFAFVWAFLILPLPLLAYWLIPAANHEESSALWIPFYQALKSRISTYDRHSSSSRWKMVLGIISWLLLVTAAAQPQWTGEPINIPKSGRDLMLAVDLSESMQIADMQISGQQVDRLTMIKSVATPFIERRKGDRIGLILFGENAYVQTPLTFDRTTVIQLLHEALIGLAGKSTAIGDAIGLAVKRLKDQPHDSRVLILLTDGANTAGQVAPLQAADLASQFNIRVYTIGIGATSMEIDRGFFGSQTVNPSLDLDEETLQGIAQKTGGQYFRAKNAADLEEIYALLDELEPVEVEQEVYRPMKTLFHWPLGIALGLTFMPLLISLVTTLFNRIRGGLTA